MPVHKVGNKWQYGTKGKKYKRKSDAIKQEQAIKISQLKRKKKK